MKEFISDIVDVFDDIPGMGVLFAAIGTILFIPASKLLVSGSGVDDIYVPYIFGGLLILGLGFLTSVVCSVLPAYIRIVSEGTVDLREKNIRFYGRECELYTVAIMWSLSALFTYSLAGLIVGLFMTLSLSAILTLAGVAVTLVALHYAVKLVFKVSNAFNHHVNDPNAHQKAGDSKDTRVA